ncbi:MAG: hypothetical protein HY057_06030, partial [Rhodospirillales bacterium]|nr:hypothetical protein [Rhodospirillales bacterium]
MTAPLSMPPLARRSGPAIRIFAMMTRHFYLLRSSWTRVFDLMYWPLLQMVIWGFITTFLL